MAAYVELAIYRPTVEIAADQRRVELLVPGGARGLNGSPANVKAYLNALPFYPNDEAARADGLTTGDHYKYSNDTDTGIYGVIKEVTPI